MPCQGVGSGGDTDAPSFSKLRKPGERSGYRGFLAGSAHRLPPASPWKLASRVGPANLADTARFKTVPLGKEGRRHCRLSAVPRRAVMTADRGWNLPHGWDPDPVLGLGGWPGRLEVAELCGPWLADLFGELGVTRQGQQPSGDSSLPTGRALTGCRAARPGAGLAGPGVSPWGCPVQLSKLCTRVGKHGEAAWTGSALLRAKLCPSVRGASASHQSASWSLLSPHLDGRGLWGRGRGDCLPAP